MYTCAYPGNDAILYRMKIHIEIDVEADPKAINEVSLIITRAIQVHGVKRFSLSSDPKTDLLGEDRPDACPDHS